MSLNIPYGQKSGGVVESVSIGNSVAAGSSGELFNVDPGQGKRVIITGLVPQSGTETDINITFGSRSIYTGSISDAPATVDVLGVMAGIPDDNTNEYLYTGRLIEIKGYPEEVLSISKTVGSTGLTIYLSYVITD